MSGRWAPKWRPLLDLAAGFPARQRGFGNGQAVGELFLRQAQRFAMATDLIGSQQAVLANATAAHGAAHPAHLELARHVYQRAHHVGIEVGVLVSVQVRHRKAGRPDFFHLAGELILDAVTVEAHRADFDNGICLRIETGGLKVEGYD